jgi:hypothetical protein
VKAEVEALNWKPLMSLGEAEAMTHQSVYQGLSDYLGCLFCKHNYADGSCAAFQSGIPLSIASGEVQHIEPVEGQANDLVFERTSATNMKDFIAQCRENAAKAKQPV